jgi:hypothetical protein
VANQTENAPFELPEGDEAFAHLVGSITDYAIFILSLDGTVLTWN